jgi:hypothetical protein
MEGQAEAFMVALEVVYTADLVEAYMAVQEVECTQAQVAACMQVQEVVCTLGQVEVCMRVYGGPPSNDKDAYHGPWGPCITGAAADDWLKANCPNRR